MHVVDSVLGELKLCIVTREFQSAPFAKKLSSLTNLLKKCQNTPEIIYIDDYLSQEDKLTPETQGAYIQTCFEKFKDHVICIPLFGSDHALKKAEFDQSLLARIMRFMLHISIVNESWLNDLELAYEGYITKLSNSASQKRKNKPLAVGKTERRFDDELSGVVPYRSCILQKLTNSLDKKHVDMLEILLNFFDVNTENKPTTPTIDGECFIVPDNTNLNSSYMEESDNGIPSILLKTVFQQIETFVNKRNVELILKGTQFVLSPEIVKFKPLSSLITSIIVKLGGEVIENESSVKSLENLYSIEDSLIAKLNYVLPQNRCSIYYILERWGMNVDITKVDSEYKFCHHFPFDAKNINQKDLSLNSSLQLSLSGFFGHKKFMAQTMLKKLNLNGVNYMTSSFNGLFTYVNSGEKYNFCVKKNIKVVNAKCIDQIYYEPKFDLNIEYTGSGNSTFLCNAPDISNRKSAAYFREIQISYAPIEQNLVIPEVVPTPEKLVPNISVETGNEKTVSEPQLEESIHEAGENAVPEVATLESKPTLKRKLAVEKSLTPQKSKKTKTETTIEELSIFDSISERISMAGGNNTELTYQDFGKRLRVILTGIDLSLETTTANYVFMSGIRNKKDLYKTNMYILDKMGLDISEEKNYTECDMVIINKKTSTFYESLAYENIEYYIDMKFIESLLEKVYKRKKSISLDLTKYWYKELLNITDFMKNRKKLGGRLIFQTLNIDNLVLLNPNDSLKNDPKEVVFKAHGYDQQIEVKGFDNRQFDINNICKSEVNNLVVINNTVKSMNSVVNEFNKSSDLQKYKVTVVTWDMVVKMLLTMDPSHVVDNKTVLVQTS